MEDLLPGGVLYQRHVVSAEDLLPWYKEKYPGQFGVVVLDQFKAPLQSHLKQASIYHVIASKEEQYFAHDRQLYPRNPHNKRHVPRQAIAAARYQGRDAFTLQDIKKATIIKAGIQSV